MNEMLTLPAHTADDSRRKALLALLLKEESRVEKTLCAITFSRFQMHILCPLGILVELRRKGEANYFAVQRELQERWKSSFSEVEFQKAWLGVEEIFRKFEMAHAPRMAVSA